MSNERRGDSELGVCAGVARRGTVAACAAAMTNAKKEKVVRLEDLSKA